MSDDHSAFYNAWTSVFGESEYHLLCDKNVKRFFTRNLNKGLNSIFDIQKRKEVYDELLKMVGESDVRIFKQKLEINRQK